MQLKVLTLTRAVARVVVVATCIGGASVGESERSFATASAPAPVWHRAESSATRPSSYRVEISRTGRSSGEPTIGVTRDGVFVSAIQDNFRVDVLRSGDFGASWEVVSPSLAGVNAHLVSYDPYVYGDPATHRVFTVDLTIACSYLSYSDDGGKSWTSNPLACGRPINDHQTLFAGPPAVSAPIAYPRVVYYCFSDVASSACSKSLDGGVTFASTGSVAFPAIDPETAGFCGGLHGHGAVGADGTVYLPREYCGQPFLAISRDEGATWSRVKVSVMGVRPNDDPAVAVDLRGGLYYSFIGEGRLPYLTTSRDGGKTWSRPVMIAPPGIAAVALLTMNVAPDGRLGFAYMGTTDKRHPKTWDGYIAATGNALARRPTLVTGRVNRSVDPLKRGECGPGRCGEEILDFIDVVVGPDGTIWASFVDACDEKCASSGLESGNEGLVTRLVGAEG